MICPKKNRSARSPFEKGERVPWCARARKKRRCPRNNARLFIEKMYEGREL